MKKWTALNSFFKIYKSVIIVAYSTRPTQSAKTKSNSFTWYSSFSCAKHASSALVTQEYLMPSGWMPNAWTAERKKWFFFVKRNRYIYRIKWVNNCRECAGNDFLKESFPFRFGITTQRRKIYANSVLIVVCVELRVCVYTSSIKPHSVVEEKVE